MIRNRYFTFNTFFKFEKDSQTLYALEKYISNNLDIKNTFMLDKIDRPFTIFFTQWFAQRK